MSTKKNVAKHAEKRAKEHHKYKVPGWSWITGVHCHAFCGMVYKECGYEWVYKIFRKEKFWRRFDRDDYLGKYKVKYNKKGVSKGDLKPGDILYTKKARPHTAIYIGDGKVAEAVRRGTRVAGLGKRFRWAFRIPGVYQEPKKDTAKKKTTTPKKTAEKKKTTTTKKTTTKKTATKKTTTKKKVHTVDHKTKYKVVCKEGMNIRTSYSTSTKKIGAVAYNKVFSVTKKHGNWVYSPQLKGWVCVKGSQGTYLKEVKK